MTLTPARALAFATTIACAVTFGSGQASAQLSPGQPIKIVVSLAPGGATDVGTRLMANAYTEQTGQQVVVENRPGGGGTTAALAVKAAPADGHTLVVIDNGACCANIFLSNVGYDATTDFKPVLMLWGYPEILVVAANSPARSVSDLVALARKTPGGLTYGSQGIATGGHLLGAMLAKAANIPMVHVPFRGAVPAATEVAAGRTDLLFASYASVRAFVDDGRLRVLASSADTAAEGLVPGYPSLPTMADAGYPDVRHYAWFMLLAPGATPDSVVQQLHSGFARALRSDAVVEKMRGMQMQVPMSATSQDVLRRMHEEIEWATPIMKSIVEKAN